MRKQLVLLLTLYVLLQNQVLSIEICNEHCDGANPSIVVGLLRNAVEVKVNSRTIILLISDADNMATAEISGGSTGDEVWIDRSFDGGLTWDDGALLGFTTIPQGADRTNTLLYNIDNLANKGLGAVRACGRGLFPSNIACTEWARSTVMGEDPVDAAATGLMLFFNGQLWNTVGWWNGANILTALIQYMRITGKNPNHEHLNSIIHFILCNQNLIIAISGSTNHRHVIETTFTNNLGEWDGNFTSDALDDTAWWTLAWIEAYDVTGNSTYLDMARFDADYMYQYVDNVCGGGIWWSIARTYKNAITNELYILTAAALHNRIPGDTKYLNQAREMWTWFKQSGMINGEHLINDGLRNDCTSNRDTTWTYNQGVILGALVELYKATGDKVYLDEAMLIADAVVGSAVLSPNGILTEPCEGSGPVSCGQYDGGCDCNAITFKGVFMSKIYNEIKDQINCVLLQIM
jgi:hypothetical protein